MPIELTTDRLRDFGTRLQGSLLQPGGEGYEDARRVWNGMVDRRPACIARCTSTADVQAAVAFAREHGLAAAIRGGGHNAAGLAVADGAVVIDLSGMREVFVDAANRTARVGGGATWGDLDSATAKHGLATTGGAISSTGVAGLTLGGGLGWLMRSYGLACDNLIGADLVLADGRAVHASESENADLFWAIRGGGGNFGVVTTFEFRLHPVSTVLGGMLVYPLARAREVIRFYRDFTANAPDALTTFVGMMHSPDGHPITAAIVCYNGPADEGERAIKPLREFEGAIAGEIGPMPYTALQTMLDAGFPSGLQVYWRSEFISAIPDELIDAAVSAYERVPSPLSAVLIEQFGGAVKRVPRESMAYDQRDADYNLVIVSRWGDPAEAERNIAWARDISAAAQPFTTGRVYVNYIGMGESGDRVRAAYGAEKYARLAAIKRTYDPGNLFRINQNIVPE